MNRLFTDSISFSVNNRKILDNASFSMENGKIAGVLGKSGAGKSSLLNIVFGTQNADRSNILINDKPVKTMYKLPGKIAMLPQSTFLTQANTVKRCISLFDLSRENRSILRTCFADFLNKKTGTLSGGERRYLEVMLILHLKRDFFLLDEPFSGIEPLKVEKIKKIIRKKSRNSGIILSSHLLDEVNDITTDLLVLKRGRLIKIENSEQLARLGFLPLKFNES